jgi:hypothetical protein
LDISLSQLPRYVNGGPMMVYEPETVGSELVVEPKKPKPSDAARKAQIKAAIRVATSPAVAKRTIDAGIVKHAAANRAKAEKMLTKLGVKFKARSATMSGIWDKVSSWFGAGKLSDTSKYTTVQREKLLAYFKAENIDVLEKTFTQEELDQALEKIRQGVPSPATSAMADPYRASSQEYQAAVTRTMAPMGATAVKAGTNAAKVVGTGIVGMYRDKKDVPGHSFEWFSKAKWAIGIAALLGGGVLLWPRIKPYVSSGSSVAQKMNALSNLFGKPI